MSTATTTTTTRAYPVILDLDTAQHIMYHLLHRVMSWFEETDAPSPVCNDDLEDLSSRAEALAQMCAAMAQPRLSQEVDAEEETKRRQAAFDEQASAPIIAPTTAARLQALRAEFTEDPDGIDLLIRLAGRLAGQNKPAPPAQTDTPAAPITTEQGKEGRA